MSFSFKNYLYNYSFNVVASSFWQKYPNDFAKHVQSIDTFHRDFDYENQRLTTYRIVRSQYNLHPAFKSMLSAVGIFPEAYGVEKSVIDLRRRTMSINAKSISYSQLLNIEERCVYREKPALEKDGEKIPTEQTLYDYNVNISCNAAIVGEAIERKAVDMLKDQVEKGIVSLEIICEGLNKMLLEQRELGKDFLSPELWLRRIDMT